MGSFFQTTKSISQFASNGSTAPVRGTLSDFRFCWVFLQPPASGILTFLFASGFHSAERLSSHAMSSHAVAMRPPGNRWADVERGEQ